MLRTSRQGPVYTITQEHTLFGAVMNLCPVILEISSATLTSNPALVFKPWRSVEISLNIIAVNQDSRYQQRYLPEQAWTDAPKYSWP